MSPMIDSFRKSPERLDGVRMDIPSDELTFIVVYDFVPPRHSEIGIGTEPVAVKDAPWEQVYLYEGTQGSTLPVEDYLSGHHASLSVNHSDHEDHALLPVAAVFLVAVPVFIDSAEPGFVYLGDLAVEAFLFWPAFAEAVEHEQGRAII